MYRRLLLTGILILASLDYAHAGKKLEMVVDTVPSGARIEFQGNTIGNTPYKTEYPKRFFSAPKSIFGRYLAVPLEMTFYKDGYYPKTIRLSQGPILWRSLDGSNQFYYHLLQHNYQIHLEPMSGQPAASAGRRNAPRVGYGTAFHSTKPGYFVTNYHVIEGGEQIGVGREGNTCAAQVVAGDKANDLAILKVQEGCVSMLELGEPFQFGSASGVAAGQDVITFGFPLPTEFAAEPQVSTGIVKSTSGFDGDARTLTISNSIQPGNSGGPLFGPDGAVVAVVTATANVNYLFPRYEAIPQDLNFAVRAEYVRLLFELNGIRPDATRNGSVGQVNAQPNGDLPGFIKAIEPNVVLVRSVSGVGQ